MRQLDSRMINANIQNPCKNRQICQPPLKVWNLKFKVEPKGLTLNLYDPKWFKALLPVQKNTIPSHSNIAILPDVHQSQLPE